MEEDAHNAAETALGTVFHPAVLAYSSAFGAGAILSCAFLLVLPEALHMIIMHTADNAGSEGLETEAWKWGTCILAGILFPWVIAIVIEQCLNAFTKLNGTFFSTNTRIISGILIGDFFHNFTDGTFIAAAFLSCSKDFGWAVAVSTIIHELAQEIADYFVLTTVCGLKPWKAIVMNFLSGTSVMFGCLTIAESDIDQNSLGYFLAFGGGIYIAIGAVECMPRIFQYTKGLCMTTISFLLFAVGAVAIGLILLDHEHCDVGGAHDGHDH